MYPNYHPSIFARDLAVICPYHWNLLCVSCDHSPNRIMLYTSISLSTVELVSTSLLRIGCSRHGEEGVSKFPYLTKSHLYTNPTALRPRSFGLRVTILDRIHCSKFFSNLVRPDTAGIVICAPHMITVLTIWLYRKVDILFLFIKLICSVCM